MTIDPGAADRWVALPVSLPADLAPGEYGVFVFVDDEQRTSFGFQKEAPQVLADHSQYHELDSPHGHDGFLLEDDQVGGPLHEFLIDVEKDA